MIKILEVHPGNSARLSTARLKVKMADIMMKGTMFLGPCLMAMLTVLEKLWP